MPAVTDWEHFATWCRLHGRQALPASPETLSLYFADRAANDPERKVGLLGMFSLGCAVTGILLPILLGMILGFATGNTNLTLLTCGLLFGGLQLIALGTGWVSREDTPMGQAGFLIAAVSSVLAIAVLWWVWSGIR